MTWQEISRFPKIRSQRLHLSGKSGPSDESNPANAKLVVVCYAESSTLCTVSRTV